MPQRALVLRALNRILNATAFWVVAALALLVGSTAFGFHCTATRSMAYVTAMKSDLKNLSMLQEDFRSRHGRYATAAEARAQLRPSTLVRLDIDHSDTTSWKARTAHERLEKTTCVMTAGDQMPKCTGKEKPPPRSIPTGNRQFDFALDLAGVAYVLARRQRRLAIG